MTDDEALIDTIAEALWDCDTGRDLKAVSWEEAQRYWPNDTETYRRRATVALEAIRREPLP